MRSTQEFKPNLDEPEPNTIQDPKCLLKMQESDWLGPQSSEQTRGSIVIQPNFQKTRGKNVTGLKVDPFTAKVLAEFPELQEKLALVREEVQSPKHPHGPNWLNLVQIPEYAISVVLDQAVIALEQKLGEEGLRVVMEASREVVEAARAYGVCWEKRIPAHAEARRIQMRVAKDYLSNHKGNR